MRGRDVIDLTAARSGAGTKRSHLREMGMPTLFGAVVLLVSATLLLGANLSALRGNLKWIEHSQQMLDQINNLETSTLGEELSVRGYALTGDPVFLQYHRYERSHSLDALAQIQRLSSVEGHQRAEFDRVRQLIDQHMALFGALAVESEDRTVRAVKAITDPVVRANMLQTRQGLRELRAIEQHEFAARQHDVADQLFRAFFLAIGIIVAAFLLGGLGVWAAQLKPPH